MRKADHRLEDDVIPRKPVRKMLVDGNKSGKQGPALIGAAPAGNNKNPPKLFHRAEDMSEIFLRDSQHVDKIITDMLYEIQIVEACVSSMRLAHNRDTKSHLRKFIHLSKTNAKLMQKCMNAMETLVKVKAGVTRIADVKISDFDYLDVFQNDSGDAFDDDDGYDEYDDDDDDGDGDGNRRAAGEGATADDHDSHPSNMKKRRQTKRGTVRRSLAHGHGQGQGHGHSQGGATETQQAWMQAVTGGASAAGLIGAVGIGAVTVGGGGGPIHASDFKRKTVIDGANAAAGHSMKDPVDGVRDSSVEDVQPPRRRSTRRRTHIETIVVTDDKGNDKLQDIEVIDEEGEEDNDEWDPDNNIEAVLHTREDAMKSALEGVAALEQKLAEANRSEAGLSTSQYHSHLLNYVSAELLSRMETMFIEIATLRLERDELRQERDMVANSLEETTRDYTNSLEETLLLRKACEDSYRTQNVEIDKILKRREDVDKSIAAAKKANRRHKSTQMACCVCALREPYRPPEVINVLTDFASVGLSRPHLKGRRSENDPAEKSDPVITAVPRNINDDAVKPIELSHVNSSNSDQVRHHGQVGTYGGRAEYSSDGHDSKKRPAKRASTASAIRASPVQPLKDPVTRDVALKIMEKLQQANRPNSAVVYRTGFGPGQPDMSGIYSNNYMSDSIISNEATSIPYHNRGESSTYMLSKQSMDNHSPSSHPISVRPLSHSASNPAIAPVVNGSETQPAKSKFSIMRSIPTHGNPASATGTPVPSRPTSSSGKPYSMATGGQKQQAINRVAAYIQHNISEEMGTLHRLS
jgi:hypothetical protein